LLHLCDALLLLFQDSIQAILDVVLLRSRISVPGDVVQEIERFFLLKKNTQKCLPLLPFALAYRFPFQADRRVWHQVL
jgi:hypothetical protein